MRVRKALKIDEPMIKQVYKESAKQIGSFNLFYVWDNYLERKTPYNFYVIEDIGFMRYGYSKTMKCYTIKEIGILNEHKGKGYAEHFFKILRSPLYLTCNKDNEVGNKFYAKMGMKLRGTKKTKNKKTEVNVWVM